MSGMYSIKWGSPIVVSDSSTNHILCKVMPGNFFVLVTDSGPSTHRTYRSFTLTNRGPRKQLLVFQRPNWVVVR